jgi:hypothetical protein
MNNTVTLISKYTSNPLPCYIIKNGRKTFAKIYPPNEFSAYYHVEMTGIAWDHKESLKDCFATVKEQAEMELDLFDFDSDVEIKGDD